MKKLFSIIPILALVIFSCSTDDDSDDTTNIDDTTNDDCTIVGRWQVGGFDNTLYEFTSDTRYTVYATEAGVFGTLDDALPTTNDWYFEGDSLVIDLNFDNYSVTYPTFRCDCNVMDLTDAFGTATYHVEGYDLEDCDE